jgi:hypothetical protein
VLPPNELQKLVPENVEQKKGGNIMADPEQLRLLQQGPDTWNRWRAHDICKASQERSTPIDLRNADLSGANLGGVDHYSKERQAMSPEDKMILYSVLQELANELRRIHRERKKAQKLQEHPEKRETLPESSARRVSKG